MRCAKMFSIVQTHKFIILIKSIIQAKTIQGPANSYETLPDGFRWEKGHVEIYLATVVDQSYNIQITQQCFQKVPLRDENSKIY